MIEWFTEAVLSIEDRNDANIAPQLYEIPHTSKQKTWLTNNIDNHICDHHHLCLGFQGLLKKLKKARLCRTGSTVHPAEMYMLCWNN